MAKKNPSISEVRKILSDGMRDSAPEIQEWVASAPADDMAEILRVKGAEPEEAEKLLLDALESFLDDAAKAGMINVACTGLMVGMMSMKHLLKQKLGEQ